MPPAVLVFGMRADRQVDLPGMVRMTNDYGRARGWNEGLLMYVNLALEELAVNVLVHGRRPRRRFEVTLREESPGRVRLDFRDDGEPFDPLTEAPAADLSSGAGERLAGGLGIHLIRAFAAEAAYRRENGRNVLSLVFDAPSPEG